MNNRITNRTVRAFLAFALTCLLVPSSQAQFVRIRGTPLRVTLPVGTSQSFVITNAVTTQAITNSGSITMNISDLPGATTATLTDTNLVALGTITNNTTFWINLNVPSSLAEGLYTFRVNISGTDTNLNVQTNTLPIDIQVAYIWNGTNNAAAGGPGDWSDPNQWLGGGTPGAGSGHDVVFTDAGAQTNTLIVTSVSTNLLTNSMISVDTTIKSLRFAMTNNPLANTNANHIIAISPGKTLTVNGTNGFHFLRDYITELNGQFFGMRAVITGTNASLVVTNPNANFTLMVDNGTSGGSAQMSTLDLSGLGTFKATVNRMALGDAPAWPHIVEVQSNNFPNFGPRKFTPNLTLARTNTIKAPFHDPNDYTNGFDHEYGFGGPGSPVSGTTANTHALRFGVTNAFFIDSIVLSHGGQQMNAQFSTTNSTLYMRGTNGGRMAMFASADQTTGVTNPVNSNCKSTMNLGGNGNAVDILVDRMWLSRDKVWMNQAQAQSTLIVGGGVIDANEIILGYQEHIQVNTNVPGDTNPGRPIAIQQSYCTGVLTVTNTAVVKVNNTLTLGYTSETNTAITDTQNNVGQLNINLGGTVMANTILVGGPRKLSVNTITLASGGTLVVSNTLADSTKGLDTFNISGGSTNNLQVDCNNTTTPLEYVNTLTMSGVNFIKIGTVKNLAAVEVPLIQYNAGSAAFSGQAIMPPPPLGVAALNGVLRKDEVSNPHVLYLDILTNAPKTLAWRGPGSSANWNSGLSGTKNWLDLSTGLMTNFLNGDNVIFDDTAAIAQTVVVTDPGMIPGTITMTNSVNNYVFTSGGGTLEGTAQWNKWGTAPLEIDAPTTVSVVLNQGSLIGNASGAIGTLNVTAGTTASYGGNVLGTVSCAGTATLSGTSGGGGVMQVQAGGIVTNLGNMTARPSLATNTLFYNGGALNFRNLGNSTVTSNATFINAGTITGDGFSIDGTFKDMAVGEIGLSQPIDFNAGALFLPGGNGFGTTKFRPDNTVTLTNGARVTFHNGSTNIFKIDPTMPSPPPPFNTLVLSGKQSFGDNPSGQTPGQFGGTLVISNTTGAPFVAGQVFALCQYFFGGDIIGSGISTNAYPIISPPTPGLGLAWDISQITATGNLGVRSISTSPVTLTNSFVFGTNTVLAGTNNVVTNTLVTHLTWPGDHTGFSLLQQITSITNGLGTNWNVSANFYSMTNNEVWITNNLPLSTSNSACTFYRLRFPPFPPE